MSSGRAFAEGTTAVRRDVLRGKVWTAAPRRVLSDRDGVLLLAEWPGVASLAPTTWIEWLRTGDDAVRVEAIPNLACGQWQLGRWVWRETEVLSWYGLDEDFSVHRFLRTSDGGASWYLNFERTPQRTAIGIDTFDLLLDLVADADLTGWEWKDEAEYAQARRLGLIDDAEHRRIESARERAVAMLKERGGPLAEAQRWLSWSPRAEWEVPVLPSGVLAADAAQYKV